MKQPVNFRLSSQTQALLARLAAERHLSKTEVLEDAIKAFARQSDKVGKKAKPHPLHKFAGIYSQEDADAAMEAYRLRGIGDRPTPEW